LPSWRRCFILLWPMSAAHDGFSFDLKSLAQAYRAGTRRPTEVAEAACARAQRSPPAVWIHRVEREAVLAAARALEARRPQEPALPLYGVPFAIKDNIDAAGLPTTAACPAYGYLASESATVVKRLVDAGGLLIGKTNMDQLATGLVGVRSPYGIPSNPFDQRYISGGSSSGSAVAVSRGLVSFALGTDTAGSGRVPAGFTNTVGIKPSGGLFSIAGVVPACRSLDCVSIFALTVGDACQVAGVMGAYDPADPYSRAEADAFRWTVGAAPPRFRFGVPAARDLEFFGDGEAQRLFEAARARLGALGGSEEPIDLRPFLETARLLYEGPWIAERLAPFEALLAQPGALLPVIAEILAEGRRWKATELFRSLHELARLRQLCRGVMGGIDFLLVPTTPTIYTIEEVAAEPRKLNARLGLYTNFVNLLGLAALALPNGFRADGLPSGVTLVGAQDSDQRLAAVGAAFERAQAGALGATGHRLPAAARGAGAAALSAAEPAVSATMAATTTTGEPALAAPVRVAVVGAHLSGQPLNHQLTDVARLLRTCSTARSYRLYALPGTTPPKPGLVRLAPSADGGGVQSAGAAIEVEVWEMARERFGDFFARVPPPLCLGTIELEDGTRVAGFLCEAYATAGARDISSFGGWRKFLAGGAA
jgi:allophanate hydrolase